MTDRILYPRVITLAKPAPEEVSQARVNLHKWVVSQLTEEPVRHVPTFERTIYITSRELTTDDAAISRWLTHSHVNRAEGASSLVLDLSTNSYDLLRDPLAHDVAEFAVMWTARNKNRSAVILLPMLPARNASIFWLPLKGTGDASRITIISNDGKAWIGGQDVADSNLGRGYAERLAKLNDFAESDRRIPLLKELGHFPVADGEAKFCARYFFDADLAITEIGRMLAAKIVDLGLGTGSAVLLSHGARSRWLHRAALLGGRLSGDAPAHDITAVSDVRELLLPGQIGIPVFDVVNSGSTCTKVVRDLVERDVPIAETVFTVMHDHNNLNSLLPGQRRLVGILPVDSEKTPRKKCVQCKMGLPFTEPLSREHGCRPFDMWHVLLHHPWVAESYGPQAVRRFPEAPDMDAIFETFGDWIAYKVAVGIGIRGPESDQEVVFVCPEETHINKLVRSLSPRFHDRVVVVRIPRSALDNPAEAFPSGDGDVDGWKVQLKHVSGAPHRIIGIIDEFNGSNTTVKAIIKILQQFDVRPDVYVPVLNRVPGAAEALPLPVRSLYEIPSPRVPLD